MDKYIKHATKFGTDQVFETAREDGMSPGDLGKLALELQRINPKYRISRPDAHWLMAKLIGKVPDERLAEMCGVTVPTVQKWALDEIEYMVP